MRGSNLRPKSNTSYATALVDLVERHNMRSVITLSHEANTESHFASYPNELVRRFLAASISQHGCCPTCGSPYARQLKKHRYATHPGLNSKVDRVDDGEESLREAHARSADSLDWDRPNRVGNRDTKRHVTSREHVGWQPGCRCEPILPPAPCRVLDPFAGTGTTLIVAKMMGCDATGIELNPTYADVIERRAKKAFGMFAGVSRSVSLRPVKVIQ